MGMWWISTRRAPVKGEQIEGEGQAMVTAGQLKKQGGRVAGCLLIGSACSFFRP
jgi:hypothetical protein